MASQMEGKIITLITGGNRGLGFETAKILLQSPVYHVLIGSRDVVKGEEAATTLRELPETKGSVEHIQLDIADDASVDSAASKLSSEYNRLNVLVNNAASCPTSSFAGLIESAPLARDVFRETFNINVVGAVSLTEAMLPLLRKSSAPRLVFVSSSTGSLAHCSDPKNRFHVASRTEYRMSKAALNFVMLQYWCALKESGFLVFSADPGLNATNLTGDPDSLRARGAPEPSIGGERIAKVVRGDRDSDVGKVCGEYGDHDVCPW